MKMIDDVEEVKDPNFNETIKEINSVPKQEVKVDVGDTLDFWEIKVDELPSKGRLYSEDIKIYGRRLKVKEVKKLAFMTDYDMEDIIKEVLKSAIKGINIDDLYDDDKLYLIFWLRANTYREPGYRISFFCSNCNTESTYDFQLENLSIKYIKDDNNYNIVLSNGDEIKLKNIQIKDRERIKNFKIKHTNFKIDSELLELASMIETINDENRDLMNRYDYISNKIDAIDYAKIETRKDEISFGINYLMNVTCSNCKGVSETGVTFRKEFFIPKYKD